VFGNCDLLFSLTSAELVDVVKGQFLLNTRDVDLLFSLTSAELVDVVKGQFLLNTRDVDLFVLACEVLNLRRIL
jgi:hypothetical protein